MKWKIYCKQIAYSIVTFGFLLGMFYFKAIYEKTLQSNGAFLLHYIAPVTLGFILGSNGLINRTEGKNDLIIRWQQLIFVTIPAAVLYFMPYIYFGWKAPISSLPLLSILLQTNLTMLSGVILGYSIISSIVFQSQPQINNHDE